MGVGLYNPTNLQQGVQLLALDMLSDAANFAVENLPVFLAVAAVIVIMMWLLAYMSRYFEYLKMLESPWLDRETLEFIHKALRAIWVTLIALTILYILHFRFSEIRSFLVALFARAPALFFIIFVIFIAAVLVRSIHRFASYLRGDLKVKPRRIAPPRALSFTEVFLKYIIYAIAGVIAFIGGISALPQDDQQYKDLIGPYVQIPQPAVVLGFAVAILAVFIVSRFIDSVFDDMKRRRTKFTPKVLEELKATTRYAVYLAGAIIILILAVDLLLTQEQLIVFTVGVIFVGLIATVIGFETIRNGLAGVTLMLANPFDLGDRVKIGNGTECHVEGIGLLMTHVRSLDGEVMSIPNMELLKKDILNFTRSPTGAMVINLSMPFSVPPSKIKTLLKEAAEKTPGIEQNPAPQVIGKEIEGTTIAYRLIARTKDVLRVEDIKSDLIANIQEVLSREGLNPAQLES